MTMRTNTKGQKMPWLFITTPENKEAVNELIQGLDNDEPILFTTMEEDENNNTVFQMKVTISDGYKIAYGDEQIPQDDLFLGIHYAG